MRVFLQVVFFAGWSLSSLIPTTLFAQKPSVKTVDFKNFKLMEDNPEALTLLKEDFKEYDPVGRLIRHILHNINPTGDLVKNIEISKTWNDIGLLEEIQRFDDNGQLIRLEKVQYDKKSKKVTEEYMEPMVNMDITYTKTYTYMPPNPDKPNANAQPSKHTLTDQKGTVIGEEVWKYNDTYEEISYKKWEMRDKVKYEEDKKTYYTKEGKLDKAEKEIKDGKDVYKEIIIFDGYKIKETTKYKNGEVVSQFGGSGGNTKYDPSKSKTLVEFGGGNGGGGGFGGNSFGGGGGFGSAAFDIVEESDDEGRKTKVTELDADGGIIQVTSYEYDAKGNTTKIKREAYMEGEVISAEEEITEYDEKNSLIRKAVVINGYTVAEDKYAYQYHQ